MSPKLPSFKRSVLFAFLLLALLASAVYLVVRLRAGCEIEVPSELGIAISYVWKGCSGLAPSGLEESDRDSPSAILDPAPFISSSPPTSPILNFNSSVSPSLFRTWGNLTFQGGSPLSYLILNATLWDGDRLVECTRYMMMEVVPGESRDFDIRECCRLSPERGYSSLLEVEEPEELFASERRDCPVVEDDPRAVVWEEISSNRSGEVGSEKASAGSLSPSAGSLSSSGSANDALTSSYFESAERYREVADLSEDLEPEEEGQSSDSSSSEQRRIEAGVRTDAGYESETGAGGGEYRYVASTTSDKYHRPDCRYAEKIKDENKIFFSDAREAEEAGYSPCKVCNPE